MADTEVAEPAAGAGVDAAPGHYDFDDSGLESSFFPSPTETPPAETAPAAEATPEAAASEVTATPAAPTAPVAPPSLTPQQQARAAAVGMSPEQVLAIGPNPEMSIVTAENIALRAFQASRQQAQQQPAAPPPPQPPVAPQFVDIDLLKKQYTEAGYEEPLQKALLQNAEMTNNLLKQQHDLAQQQYQMSLKDRERDTWSAQAYNTMQALSQAQTQQQVRHVQELAERDYDTFVKNADPQLQKLLQDPTAKGKMFQAANVILTGMFHNGITASPNQELYQTAAMMAFGQNVKAMVREEVRQEVKQAQGRALSRPSGSAKTERTGSGEDRAASFAEEFYRNKLGLGTFGAAKAEAV